MNFFNLTVLIFTSVFFGGLSLILLGFSLKSKKSQKVKIALGGLSAVFFTLFILVVILGKTTSYSNAIKLNDNNTVTEFFIVKDESYTMKSKLIGPVKISYRENENARLNKKVKLTRNLIFGTTIEVNKTSKDLFYTEK